MSHHLSPVPASMPARLSWLAPLWGCVLGVAWQVTQPGLWPLPAYQCLMLLGLALFLGIPRFMGRQLVCWLLLMLGAACCSAGLTGWRAQAYLAQTLPKALEAVDLEVEGTIASMLQNTANGQRWRFEVDQATTGVQGLPELIELSWYGPYGQELDASQPLLPPWSQGLALSPGQRWRFTVRIKRPHGARNPHGFDYELLAWEQGVQATGYVREKPLPQLLEVGSAYRLQRWRQWLRERIRGQTRQLHAWLPALDPERQQAAMGVVAALAVGDQQAIDRADWALFRQTGVAHLMSISGLHITMFAWVAALLVGRLWRLSARACRWQPAPRVALLAGVLLAAAYAVFSGWGLPAQRTVCMLTVAALLQGWGVRWPWPCVWLLALAVVVTADPWALWQAGFWLSFVAVGVLLATDSGASRADGERVARRFISRLQALWREQWLISLALAPLGLLLFGQVSIVGLLANLLAIPWVTLVVTPLALLAAFVPMAAACAALAMLPLMHLLQWLGQLPWAVWALPQPDWWASVLAIAAGLLLIAPLPWRLRLVSAALAFPALWWPAHWAKWGEFELLAVDIGQGNAVIISTAAHRLLYDAGPQYSRNSDAGERVLLPLLAAQGMRLDVMMLSHRDLDHTGGALAVKAALPGLAVMGSSSVVDDPKLAQLAPVQACTQGLRWQWEGVEFEVLHPPPGEDWLKGRRFKPNFASCVLRIVSASGRVAWLTGDIEAPQEQQLLQSGAVEPVDWLLVPHHGSKTSSTQAWVQGLRPRWAVVQAGYLNRFGHPVAEISQRYLAAGSELVLQDGCGAISWSSAKPLDLRCERQARSRYWDVHKGAVPVSRLDP